MWLKTIYISAFLCPFLPSVLRCWGWTGLESTLPLGHIPSPGHFYSGSNAWLNTQSPKIKTVSSQCLLQTCDNFWPTMWGDIADFQIIPLGQSHSLFTAFIPFCCVDQDSAMSCLEPSDEGKLQEIPGNKIKGPWAQRWPHVDAAQLSVCERNQNSIPFKPLLFWVSSIYLLQKLGKTNVLLWFWSCDFKASVKIFCSLKE